VQPLHGDERVVLAVHMRSAGTPRPLRTPNPDAPWWLEGDAPADADELRAQRAKQRQPLLHLTVRIGVVASDDTRANALLGRAISGLRVLNATGVQLVRRWWLPASVVIERLLKRSIPLTAWRVTANIAEAAG